MDSETVMNINRSMIIAAAIIVVLAIAYVVYSNQPPATPPAESPTQTQQ